MVLFFSLPEIILVISSVLLARHHLLGVEELHVGAGPDLVNHGLARNEIYSG